MARKRFAADKAGFTLLEMLVSLAILSLMASMVYSTFARTSASAARAEEFMDLNHVSRFIINRLTDDLASASLLPNSGSGYFTGQAGETPESPEGARVDSIVFTGFGRRLSAPGTASDQAVISWYAQKTPGKDTYTLMRSESFGAPAKPEENDKPDPAAAEFDVTDSLTSFEISYHTPGALNGDWADSYDSKITSKIPTAVRIKFTLMDAAGGLITRSALIPAGESL